MRTKEEWLGFHQFGSMGQALRQIMNYVEFGEAQDGEVMIFTNLKFSANGNETVVDMDTLVRV